MGKTAIVIGSGAGGAMMAKELQGPFQVTILEAGKEFKPFMLPVHRMARLRPSGLFFDERLIRLFLPNMVIDKTREMTIVRGSGIGGTTTLATGNAVRYDGALKNIGIDLDREFEHLYQELPITTDHCCHWTETTKRMYRLFQEMGLDPFVTPKFLYSEKCVGCGHCAIGCPHGAKWDSRALVNEAVEKGAELIRGCKVTDLTIVNDKVTQVNAVRGRRRKKYQADLIVLAAGGLGSPAILQNSGIPCQTTLFVDPVLCIAGHLPGIRQDRQILMPFISQQDGYILSPYMDYLSFFFHKKWRYPMKNIASIMIKLADEEYGTTDGHKILKPLTDKDRKKLRQAVIQSQDILEGLGLAKDRQFKGIINAGHPGGMLPLTRDQKDSLHHDRLPANLYLADATILPKSMGNPPMLTIMALAKKIADRIKNMV